MIGSLLFLVVLVNVPLADASSAGGDQLGRCFDARTDVGCDPKNWPGGDRLKCTIKNTMDWAGKTTYTSAYSLRAVKGYPYQDVTSYIPDEWLTILLDVKHYAFKWRGIAIHAIKKSDGAAYVGDWNMTSNQNRMFVVPGKGCIMHAQADIKPLRVAWRYKGPPAGTGTIQFKALIKYGPANTGWFYFPNGHNLNQNKSPADGFPGVGTDLELSESSSTSGNWGIAPRGSSCTQYCSAAGKTCKQETLRDSTYASPGGMEKIMYISDCPTPISPSCSTIAPARDAKSGKCWYNGAHAPDADAICAAAGAGPASTGKATCDASHADAQRFCFCE